MFSVSSTRPVCLFPGFFRRSVVPNRCWQRTFVNTSPCFGVAGNLTSFHSSINTLGSRRSMSSEANDGKVGNPDDSDDGSKKGSTKDIGAIVAVSKEGGQEVSADAPPFEPHIIVFPVAKPLLPGQQQLLHLTGGSSELQSIAEIIKSGSQPLVGAFLRKPQQESEVSDADVHKLFHSVGTRARVRVLQANPFQATKGGLQVILAGFDVIRLEKVLSVGPPMKVQVSRIRKPKSVMTDELRAFINEILQTVREIMKINAQFREQAALISQAVDRSGNDPYDIAHFAASLTTAEGVELIKMLEESNPVKKLQLALLLMKKELDVSKMQQKIAAKIEEKVSSQQREFLLREQMKAIKKELGEDVDGSKTVMDKFKQSLEDKIVPKDVKDAIEAEMEKFTNLANTSQEYQTSRNYLEWLTQLPWGVYSKDTLSLAKARKILNRDHYGLDDVKERIVELIAVGALRGLVQGKILCLVGPPGVGKTSIGRSIAEALGREYFRFSVGGLYDVAEIKGHRRTYVGAMPGKIIQGLKKIQTANPLFLVDEVDKIGRGHQGDPASALLELLDPSQNDGFLDHYLDVPVDCSRILFICTANVTDTIPGPLLDRMEVLRLSGYDAQEKIRIAQDFLVPQIMGEVGLCWNAEKGQLKSGKDEPDMAADKLSAVVPPATIEESAIESLIRWYCREAGVRNLEKHIEKICRKLATKLIEYRERSELDATEPNTEKSPSLELRVNENNLSEYVGKPVFTSDRLYEGKLPCGTVTGLAWTAMGGAVLYIEAISLPKPEGSPVLKVTGQLGDVMKESSQLALLVARQKFKELGLESNGKYFETHEFHVHCPEGATPKDGPSAGVTMTTALLSVALGRPPRANLAMTGEVSLNGKVLRVGGIKEKTIAARRAGCTALLFPDGNRRDFDELPEYLKQDLEVNFASVYDDVFEVAFAEERT